MASTNCRLKPSKKLRTATVKMPKRLKVTFRNPRINVSGGEAVGITGAIWRYIDLNRIRVKGYKDNTGVFIVSYVDYLLTHIDKYSGYVDKLWNIINKMKKDTLATPVKGKQMDITLNSPKKI